MKDGNSYFSTAIDCFQALIALVNLIVIWKFSADERKRHSQERDEDAKKRNDENNLEAKRRKASTIFMYEVADRLLKIVDNHFDELYSKIDDYSKAKGQDKCTAVRDFKDEKASLKYKVMSSVNAIDKDRVSDFLVVFNVYEDEMTKMIGSESYVTRRSFQETLESTRGKLFNLLIHLNVEI